MVHTTRQPSAPGDDKGLARARERFLTAESVEPDHVRDTILASWWRSRRSRRRPAHRRHHPHPQPLRHPA